jgi:hypothetical protein
MSNESISGFFTKLSEAAIEDFMKSVNMPEFSSDKWFEMFGEALQDAISSDKSDE